LFPAGFAGSPKWFRGCFQAFFPPPVDEGAPHGLATADPAGSIRWRTVWWLERCRIAL
jgi:hypothetical protein